MFIKLILWNERTNNELVAVLRRCSIVDTSARVEHRPGGAAPLVSAPINHRASSALRACSRIDPSTASVHPPEGFTNRSRSCSSTYTPCRRGVTEHSHEPWLANGSPLACEFAALSGPVRGDRRHIDPARILAEYFGGVVVAAATNLDDRPTVCCRPRPDSRRRRSGRQRYRWRAERSWLLPIGRHTTRRWTSRHSQSDVAKRYLTWAVSAPIPDFDNAA